MLAVIKPQSKAITPIGITDKITDIFDHVLQYATLKKLMPSAAEEINSVDVSQQRSTVGRDQIGNQIVNKYYSGSVACNPGINSLLEKLQDEMASNVTVADRIAKLQRFEKTSAYKGVAGLEAKLNASGRAYEYDDAIEMKELFAKLVEEFSLYASAQEIIAYLLARVEYHFRTFIYPQVENLSVLQINEIVHEKIIVPTVQECGSSVFSIDHSIAMGMVYWLAEQCHVRWHQ